MLTQVARSRIHCLVTAGDEFVSRISFSLSPYSSFRTRVFYVCLFLSFFLSFTKLQINIYFYWRNVHDGYDLVPKLKYARERG